MELLKRLGLSVPMFSFADESVKEDDIDTAIAEANAKLDEETTEPETEEEEETEETEDTKLPFSKHPRWKEVYRGFKEGQIAKSELEELKTKMDEVQSQVEEYESIIAKKEEKVEPKDVKTSKAEVLAYFEKKGYDVTNVTPEQLTGWTMIYDMVKEHSGSAKSESEKIRQEIEQERLMAFHNTEREKAKKFVEARTALKWEEVEKELERFVKGDKRMLALGQQFGAYELLKSWFADNPKSFDSVKKKSKEEIDKLNAKKRKVMSETSDFSSKGDKTDDLELGDSEFVKKTMAEASLLFPD